MQTCETQMQSELNDTRDSQVNAKSTLRIIQHIRGKGLVNRLETTFGMETVL